MSLGNGESDSGSFKFLRRSLVFASSLTYVGDFFGGVNGGDAECQSLATNAGLSGTWMAWLSAGGQDSPNFRFTKGSFWELVTGEIVADSWSDLVDHTLDHAIDRTETGDPAPTTSIWTGTLGAGGSANIDCSKWTDGTGQLQGIVGNSTATDLTWTAFSGSTCNIAYSIFCFEQ